jgi:hypothetical protein
VADAVFTQEFDGFVLVGVNFGAVWLCGYDGALGS